MRWLQTAPTFRPRGVLDRRQNARDRRPTRNTCGVRSCRDLDSRRAATIRGLEVSLDVTTAKSEVASPPTLQMRDMGSRTSVYISNYIGHFCLGESAVGSGAQRHRAPLICSSSKASCRFRAEGITFDNLDGHQFLRSDCYISANPSSRRRCMRRGAIASFTPSVIAVNCCIPAPRRACNKSKVRTF